MEEFVHVLGNLDHLYNQSRRMSLESCCKGGRYTVIFNPEHPIQSPDTERVFHRILTKNARAKRLPTGAFFRIEHKLFDRTGATALVQMGNWSGFGYSHPGIGSVLILLFRKNSIGTFIGFAPPECNTDHTLYIRVDARKGRGNKWRVNTALNGEGIPRSKKGGKLHFLAAINNTLARIFREVPTLWGIYLEKAHEFGSVAEVTGMWFQGVPSEEDVGKAYWNLIHPMLYELVHPQDLPVILLKLNNYRDPLEQDHF